VCNLRLDPHAQQETSEIAEKILEAMKTTFPVSTKYLVKGQ
jgi:thymidylate synthase ThyX